MCFFAKFSAVGQRVYAKMWHDHQCHQRISESESCIARMKGAISHAINWSTNPSNYLSLYTYIYIYIYDPGPRSRSPPLPPQWYGPLLPDLESFISMVFTAFHGIYSILDAKLHISMVFAPVWMENLIFPWYAQHFGCKTSYFHTNMPTYLYRYIPTYLHTYMHTYLRT